MSLLFLACWFHSLAKLKIHTETTVDCLRSTTTDFTRTMWRFKTETCDKIPAFELEQEEQARKRRLAREKRTVPPGGKKKKTLNLCTYKFHALGDYVSSILWFGTTDSYSTQTVSIHSHSVCCVFLNIPEV